MRVKSRPGKVIAHAFLDQAEDDDAAAGGDELVGLLHRRRRAGGFHDHRHAFAIGHFEHALQQSGAARDGNGAEIGRGGETLGERSVA